MCKYWIGITSQKNLEANRRLNFPVAGFSDHLRKRVKQVEPGDKVLAYVEGLYRFAAICEATSKYYYDNKNKIWPEDSDAWPCRFRTRPLLVLADSELLDVKKLVPQLTFITPRQKATKWGLALQQGLIEIPEEDFGLVESEMKKSKTRSRKVFSGNWPLKSKNILSFWITSALLYRSRKGIWKMPNLIILKMDMMIII